MLIEQNMMVGGDYQNVHPQMPLANYSSMMSRQKGHQTVNTQGMIVTPNQPLQNMNARGNSSNSKNNSVGGENSFEKKVSKTPKAPGAHHPGVQTMGTDSQFTSNSSTADKAQYSSNMQQQIVRGQSRQGGQRQIAVIRHDSQMMHQHIDNKVLKVEFPQPGDQAQLQERPQTKNKRGSNVVSQLREAVGGQK